MKPKHLALLILTSSLMLTTACGKTEETLEEEIAEDIVVDEVTSLGDAKETDTYKAGDVILMGDLTFQVNAIRDISQEEFSYDEDNNIIFIEVEVENVGNKDITLDPSNIFRFRDSSGDYMEYILTNESRGEIEGKLQVGHKLKGELTYKVPTDFTDGFLEIDVFEMDSQAEVNLILK